jgi:ABC-type lipoprotein export system ATPase subunit
MKPRHWLPRQRDLIAAPARLEAQNIGFEYARGHPVIGEWSAVFSAGSLTAITGPSGRGKSTLLYILGLMLMPSSGHVLLDGEVVSSMHDAARARTRARMLGFVFQDAALDHTRTVIDNVTEVALYAGQSRAAAHSRATELLKRFEVTVPAHRKPGQVSGGQAQRIALCRALMNDPAVLFADEPTGNLDSATSGLVVGALRDHASTGAAVVVVTHSAEVAAACDSEIQM